jgi:uncharacterized membrane protein YeaQ/YmgE (transglycosylase-associated protein family)
MDFYEILVQLVIAIVCAGIATILIPRQVPGKVLGLIILGFAGVWFGDWLAGFLRQQYGLTFDFLEWQIQGVAIVPAIIGSTILLYIVTTFLKWGRYSH